jgi:hypothetical protein
VETLIYTFQLVITVVAVINSFQDQASITHNGVVSCRYVHYCYYYHESVAVIASIKVVLPHYGTAVIGSIYDDH